MAKTIIDIIKTAEDLPSLPTVAQEVLRLTRDDDVSVAQIAAVIQKDPALTARVLKTVNSPLFGMASEVSSVQHAMVVLGLRAVKVIVLGFSLVDTLRAKGNNEGLDYALYWRRSLSTAVAARLLARITTPLVKEEAFIAGLLSDIGIIASWRCARTMYKPVIEAAHQTGEKYEEIERRILGVTHAAIGGELLQGWNLPSLLQQAVRAHHGEGIEELEDDTRRFACLVHAAALISAAFCQDRQMTDLDALKLRCLELTGINKDQLETVLLELDRHVRDTASLLAINVGPTLDYEQLQLEAGRQLTELTVQAEVERARSLVREEELRLETTRLQSEKQAILEMASKDALTGLANRAAFDQRMAEEFDRYGPKYSVGLIMMDVDHFKTFNDTYGHQAGDAVLQLVGACLRQAAARIGYVARYGGEEFAIVVSNQPMSNLCHLAEILRRAVMMRSIESKGEQLHVTASFGVASTDFLEHTTADSLIAEADRQLYRAKAGGRNRVESMCSAEPGYDAVRVDRCPLNTAQLVNG